MIVLTIVACLVAHPTQCEKRMLDIFPNELACMLSAQPSAAEFARYHPAVTVTRMTCQRPGRDI